MKTAILWINSIGVVASWATTLYAYLGWRDAIRKYAPPSTRLRMLPSMAVTIAFFWLVLIVLSCMQAQYLTEELTKP